MLERFTERAKVSINLAQNIAQELGQGLVGTEHLLFGLVCEGDGIAAKVLKDQGITEEGILKSLNQLLLNSANVKAAEEIDFTPRVKFILQNSMNIAASLNMKFIGTEHILLAILQDINCVAFSILLKLKVDISKLISNISKLLDKDKKEFSRTFYKNTTNVEAKTEILDKYGKDLIKLAKQNKFDPVIGREKEIKRVIQILTRRTKNNPCLIGEPGVGKTAIAEGLALKIVEGSVPEILKNKRIYTLELSSMVAGSKYRGEFEDRLKKALEEVIEAGNIILFIDEMHTIIGAGAAEGSIDASTILKPQLARGDLQVIGATTLTEYRKHFEKDSALARRFQPITVNEPSETEAIEILRGVRDKYEAHHKITITDEAIVSAVKLSNRYISDRFLPDKAIDLIDEGASRVRLELFTAPDEIKELEAKLQEVVRNKEYAIKLEEYGKASVIKKEEDEIKQRLEELNNEWESQNINNKQIVDEEVISEVVSEWTGIPVSKLQQTEMQKLLNMEGILHKRVIAQEEAIKAVSKAVRRGRVGMKDPKRPIGSFLFLGPTGVGKTELCKALAEVLFGDENSVVRIDMSEFMEKHDTSKLVGSSPGYVGYEEGGQLSNKVRNKPYSVVLFDEIEKAHPEVFNMLLQILEDGHITDGQGHKIDFKNTVIIMTSNAGAKNIVSPKKIGFTTDENKVKQYEDMKSVVMGEIKNVFKPEFINRIDEIVVFHQLDKENIKDVAAIMINQLTKRIKDNMNINVTVTDSAKQFLADEGYDPTYGARPLRRVIQSKVEDRLAEEVLEERVKDGDTVEIDLVENDLVFKVI